jgi:hypothetical protein
MNIHVLIVIAGITEPMIQTLEPLACPPPTTFDRLMALDCWLRPGLTMEELRELLGRCTCGLVTTRRTFYNHICLARKADEDDERGIIDLTDTDIED